MRSLEVGFWVNWRDVVKRGAERVVEDLWGAGAAMASLFVVAGGKLYFKLLEEYFGNSGLKLVQASGLFKRSV